MGTRFFVILLAILMQDALNASAEENYYPRFRKVSRKDLRHSPVYNEDNARIFHHLFERTTRRPNKANIIYISIPSVATETVRPPIPPAPTPKPTTEKPPHSTEHPTPHPTPHPTAHPTPNPHPHPHEHHYPIYPQFYPFFNPILLPLPGWTGNPPPPFIPPSHPQYAPSYRPDRPSSQRPVNHPSPHHPVDPSNNYIILHRPNRPTKPRPANPPSPHPAEPPLGLLSGPGTPTSTTDVESDLTWISGPGTGQGEESIMPDDLIQYPSAPGLLGIRKKPRPGKKPMPSKKPTQAPEAIVSVGEDIVLDDIPVDGDSDESDEDSLSIRRKRPRPSKKPKPSKKPTQAPESVGEANQELGLEAVDNLEGPLVLDEIPGEEDSIETDEDSLAIRKKKPRPSKKPKPSKKPTQAPESVGVDNQESELEAADNLELPTENPLVLDEIPGEEDSIENDEDSLAIRKKKPRPSKKPKPSKKPTQSPESVGVDNQESELEAADNLELPTEDPLVLDEILEEEVSAETVEDSLAIRKKKPRPSKKPKPSKKPTQAPESVGVDNQESELEAVEIPDEEDSTDTDEDSLAIRKKKPRPSKKPTQAPEIVGVDNQESELEAADNLELPTEDPLVLDEIPEEEESAETAEDSLAIRKKKPRPSKKPKPSKKPTQAPEIVGVDNQESELEASDNLELPTEDPLVLDEIPEEEDSPETAEDSLAIRKKKPRPSKKPKPSKKPEQIIEAPDNANPSTVDTTMMDEVPEDDAPQVEGDFSVKRKRLRPSRRPEVEADDSIESLGPEEDLIVVQRRGKPMKLRLANRKRFGPMRLLKLPVNHSWQRDAQNVKGPNYFLLV